MARPREIAGLDCDEPFRCAAARVIEVRAAEVFERSRDVLDLDDVERVHDMRVATRRLRATMEVFAPCLPRKRHRKALKRVRALADALGARRDRDVEIEFLADLAGGAGEVGEAGEAGEAGAEPVVEGLIQAAREAQRAANEELAAFVTPKRLRKLRRRLDELIGAARA